MLLTMPALDLDCLAAAYDLMPLDCLALMLFLACPIMMIMACHWTTRCPSHCTVAMTSFLMCRCLPLTCDEMPQLLTRSSRHDELYDTLPYLVLPQFLNRSHDELTMVLPRCPEMPQLPQSLGRHNEPPQSNQTDLVLPQLLPPSRHDELPLVHTCRELPQPEPGQDELPPVLYSLAEGGFFNSLAEGGVAARIFQGEEDLATRCSPARRGVAKLISWAEGGGKRGVADQCSWTEGGHLETSRCSSSMTPTLSLLRGRRRKGRREIKSMTTADDCQAAAAQILPTQNHSRLPFMT